MTIPWNLIGIVAAAGAAVAIGVTAVTYYTGEIEKSAVAETAVAQAQQNVKDTLKSKAKLQALFDEADELAKLHKKQLDLERKHGQELLKKLDELSKSDPEVERVLNTAIPEHVRRLRRESIELRNKDGGSVQRSNVTTQADSGTGSGRQDGKKPDQ